MQLASLATPPVPTTPAERLALAKDALLDLRDAGHTINVATPDNLEALGRTVPKVEDALASLLALELEAKPAAGVYDAWVATGWLKDALTKALAAGSSSPDAAALLATVQHRSESSEYYAGTLVDNLGGDAASEPRPRGL